MPKPAPAAELRIERVPCATKGDELLIFSGFVHSYPQSQSIVGRHGLPPTVISLRRMEQIFPSPVDNVDPIAVYGADQRIPLAKRPWVMSNMIASIDGSVSVDGLSGGLGGPGDKAVFTAIRAVPDIIVVASGTVVAEDYRRPQTSPEVQASRIERGQDAFPRIAIVSGSLSIDPGHRVFDPEARPLVITHAQAPPDRVSALGEVADVLVAGETEVDLNGALETLRSNGASVVLLEGGPTLNGAFVEADLIDEWCQSSAPLLVGGSAGRVVKSRNTSEARTFALARTLHDEGFLFHRYVRDRQTNVE